MSDSINWCDLKKNAKHIGEVSTGRVDGSPTGAVIDTSTNEVTGQVRDTLTGKLKKFDAQLVDQDNQFDIAVNNWNTSINSQFIYKNGGLWADAPAQITDAEKLTYWIFTDGSGYAVKGSVTLPIPKPITPVNDDNWFDATSVNKTKVRTDSASQLGGVYKKDYETGDIIPTDAMKDKLMYWHDGRFYSIGTDTGFTSNDFDADLAAGRFVSAGLITNTQFLITSEQFSSRNLNAVAQANNIAVERLKIWQQGLMSKVGDFWLYNDSLYTYGEGSLPTSPQPPWSIYKYEIILKNSLYDCELAFNTVNKDASMTDYDVDARFGANLFLLKTFIGGGTDNNIATYYLSDNNYEELTVQADVYFDGSQNSAYVGWSDNTPLIADTTKTYGLGFKSDGLYFNDRVTEQKLVGAADITNGWQNLTVIYRIGGSITCTMQKDTTTRAKVFVIQRPLLAKPVSAAMIAYDSTNDKVRRFRYNAGYVSNIKHPVLGDSGSSTPLIYLGDKNPSAQLLSLHLPAGYDPRVKYRLCVYCHGSGGTNNDIWDYANENSVIDKLVRNGYVVLASNYETSGWGNDDSVSQNYESIKFVMSTYNVTKPYMLMQSMGGIVGFNTMIFNELSVSCVAAIYPAVNLKWQYDNVHSAQINTAYNISPSNPYETATAGHDVINDNQDYIFKGLQCRMWSSYGDTIVSRAKNSDLLMQKINDGGGNASIITVQGDHGDPSAFNPDEVLAFFDAN